MDFSGLIDSTRSSIVRRSPTRIGRWNVVSVLVLINVSPGNGGGVNNQGKLTVTNCTFSTNSAVNGGGVWDSSR